MKFFLVVVWVLTQLSAVPLCFWSALPSMQCMDFLWIHTPHIWLSEKSWAEAVKIKGVLCSAEFFCSHILAICGGLSTLTSLIKTKGVMCDHCTFPHVVDWGLLTVFSHIHNKAKITLYLVIKFSGTVWKSPQTYSHKKYHTVLKNLVGFS